MILFHVTTKAKAKSIRRAGFKGREKVLGLDDTGRPFAMTGVWFSDKPSILTPCPLIWKHAEDAAAGRTEAEYDRRRAIHVLHEGR